MYRFTRLIFLSLLVFLSVGSVNAGPGQKHGKEPGMTADHAKFDVLKRDFSSGPEVTKACLSCHTEAAKQVMDSIHWTWEFAHQRKDAQVLGKRNVINSFCGNVRSNEPRCTSCHVGYGWDDMTQAAPQEEHLVDCLICHDMTGTYTKYADRSGAVPVKAVPEKAKTITGAQAQPVNLAFSAQTVGLPNRENCGQCHFFGGGGDNVKHGDLSTALYSPSFDVDVHMEQDGLNFACSTCHLTKHHKWPGSRYKVKANDLVGTGQPGQRRDVATCESCHGKSPHEGGTLGHVKLNDHVDRVACQTCHIPAFARGGVATKTKWDWSTAGRLKDGKPYSEDHYVQSDGQHLHTYMSTKGHFEYGENVVPYYAWFNGDVVYTTDKDIIDPDQVVEVNKLGGDASDPRARIWPFKRMEGRQAYDRVHLTLLNNHVYGPDTDTALWTNFDFARSLAAGTQAAGQPFSGDFGFVDTYMYWPITHMVAPYEQALKCDDCHDQNGRMSELKGFYMPGRNGMQTVDWLGLALIALAIAGVLLHAMVRLFGRGKGA